MTKTKLSIAEQLESLGACDEAVEWSKPYGTDRLKAWRECQRGDWMLWLIGTQAGPPESVGRKKLVLAACGCTRLALPYTKDPRVLACIETAEKWAKGEATIEQLRGARRAADAAAYAAAYAADAAADAAAYAAASYAAAAYADAAARTKVLAECADIVREYYPKPPAIKTKETP